MRSSRALVTFLKQFSDYRETARA
ncbi:hypothetical protein AERO9AM_30527 [Aeromicrobium sp. 9AM]|nr:hypothetical protein AERO9AM_30527 [Aeromicrobium sp. 9AM]